MTFEPKRILVVAPHTDDESVATGGSISRFLRKGREVHVVVLSLASAADPSQPKDECSHALAILGVPEANIDFHDFPTRRLNEQRQAVLDVLLEARQRVNPDLVIIPSLKDIHQDHRVVAEEGMRAFKNHATILCFTYPWNLLAFDTTCFVTLEEFDVENKIRAIAEYKSQVKDYLEPEAIRSWARTMGLGAKSKYAESFEVARMIL